MPKESYVRWFENVRLKGGKTGSLGELYALPAAKGGRVPDGFALSARAYRKVLTLAGAWDGLRRLLSDLDRHDVKLLTERAEAAAIWSTKPSAIRNCARSQRRIVSGDLRYRGYRSRCAARRPPRICRLRASRGR
jgi:hypothetical protein